MSFSMIFSRAVWFFKADLWLPLAAWYSRSNFLASFEIGWRGNDTPFKRISFNAVQFGCCDNKDSRSNGSLNSEPNETIEFGWPLIAASISNLNFRRVSVLWIFASSESSKRSNDLFFLKFEVELNKCFSAVRNDLSVWLEKVFPKSWMVVRAERHLEVVRVLLWVKRALIERAISHSKSFERDAEGRESTLNWWLKEYV